MAKQAAGTPTDPIPALDVQALTTDVPRGSWAAISKAGDRCVAFGDSLDEAISKAEAKGETSPLIVRVPETEGALFL